MSYTSELKELIKKVEATRPTRIEKKRRGEEFRLLTLKEREVPYHPTGAVFPEQAEDLLITESLGGFS